MKIYIGATKSDKERAELLQLIDAFRKKNIDYEINDSFIVADEINKISGKDNAIILFSKNSICSTFFLGLIDEINKFNIKKYFYIVDEIELPNAFKSRIKDYLPIDNFEKELLRLY